MPSRFTWANAATALCCAVLLAAVVAVPAPASASTLPPQFFESQIVSGLTRPTAMALVPDGRIFVAEQDGQLRVVKGGALLPTPFVSLTVNSSGERGLLGVTVDPNFLSNQFVYLYYTATTPTLHNRVSRFTANGDVALAGSEVILMDLESLSATNHNGGALHFGPDGKLYVAVGENAVSSNSQTLNNRLGKLLRVNSDGSIPGDNPFFNTAAGLNRSIWALGLRNPYTFAFQSGTNRMFINDVGATTFEEINEGLAGANYGWPNSEGPTSTSGHTGPLFHYGHGSGNTTGCAITGGVFYNPPRVHLPLPYVGKYFFADFCNNWIRVLDPQTATAAQFAINVPSPVDLRVDDDGFLYYLARGTGSIWRVGYWPPNANDFNRDGHTDLVWQKTADGVVDLWHLQNLNFLDQADLLPSGTPPPGWRVVTTGEFNGDLRPDIVLQGPDGATRIWLMNDETINSTVTVHPGPVDGWRIVASGDFGMNSRADLVWQHPNGQVFVWFLDGTTLVGGAYIHNAPTDWKVVTAGDFSGDGQTDLVWQHTSGAVYVWFLSGTTLIGGGYLFNGATDWDVIGSGLLNPGDTKRDLLWRHADGNNFAWFLNGMTLMDGAYLSSALPDRRPFVN